MQTKLDKLLSLLQHATALAEELKEDQTFLDKPVRSDGALLHDLHHFVWALWRNSGATEATRRAVHRSKIMEFLSTRCEAEKAMRLLELVCLMGWLEQQPDSLLFVPKARGFITAE